MIMCRFLLVSLNIDAILGEVTIRRRRKKLEEMARGNGLSDAYTATLTRLKAQKGYKSVLGLKVLMWVLYSERPLRAEELCHALGVDTESADLDPNNVPALRTLLASCLGLAAVEASSSTVRMAHFTLQEHLLGSPTLFHGPHSTIAEVCLKYLTFRSVRDLSPTLNSAPSTMPLLEYASLYWANHTRRGMAENVKMLALRLLDRLGEHISAQLLLLHYSKDSGSGPFFSGAVGPSGFTGLHGVAFLGIAEMVASVLEMKEWDVNATDCTGSTPLAWAARGGYEGVVKMLLELEGINPDKADTKFERTPLSWAAENGHEKVVKLLLERDDVNTDRVDNEYGRTPLSWASLRRNEGVVEMLLERNDGRFATPDKRNQASPSLALSERHSDAVRILQGNANAHITDRSGQALLPQSAQHRHECAVGMISRARDPNTDIADLSTQPTLLLTDPDTREALLDSKDSVPTHVENDLSATELPMLPQSPPTQPLKSLWPPRKTDTHPSDRSHLPFTVDRYFLIASFICLSAFLVYILPSFLITILFSSHT